MNGSILCVTRNNLYLSKQAINSALAQTVPCDVFVQDNASTDGTREWLRSKVGIAYVPRIVQVSLAECWNKGLKALFNAGASEVLVINNDVVLRPDTYWVLANINRPFVTAVSVDTAAKLGSPGDREPSTLAEAARPHPDFSCFMIRKEVWERVGNFDEIFYPAYCEDSDYHVRMHRAKIRAICVDMPFLHLGASTVKNASEGERAQILRMADKNREAFRSRYGCLPGTPEYEALFT
jgi:GT2 family glycosyltransferase